VPGPGRPASRCGRGSGAGNTESEVAAVRRLLVALLSVVLLIVAPSATASAQTATTKLPNSIAAIGDSVTQAADVCCWYGDHPANSWSTGNASWDGVSSHYERIRRANPTITGRSYNDAVSGAKMSDAAGQAASAVGQGADYVTILMGANDLCTPTVESMTPIDTFRTLVQQALAALHAGLPRRSHVFVSSIPDVYQLWNIYHTDSTAQFVWDVANICQSLLSPDRTEAQRGQVRERNIAFNAVLQEECARYSRCKFDDNAVFEYQFTRSDVTTLDYFHPNLTGQSRLAALTWSRSWWS
jgi:lysophospholipase L1-like esterase